MQIILRKNVLLRKKDANPLWNFKNIAGEKNGIHLPEITVLSHPKLIGSVLRQYTEAIVYEAHYVGATVSHISNTATFMKDSYSHLQDNYHFNLKPARRSK